MKNGFLRILALMMTLMLLLADISFAEDVIEEDVVLDEDGTEMIIDDETGEQFIVGSGESLGEDLLEADYELDQSIDPDKLELNENLPDNVVNILLVGIDTRSTGLDNGLQNGDVQIILSLNKDTGSVKLTSIQRDSYVQIPGYANKNRINVSYARGGGRLAMRTINHNFDMNIQYYVAINFFGLASIIDAIGGIDIDMSKTEAGAINAYLKKNPPVYDNNKGVKRTPLEKKSGVQHCDGIQAVMYARLRQIDNDFARTERQRKLLELLLSEVMKDMTLDKMISLMETSLPYVVTNLTPNMMLELGMVVLSSGLIQKAQSGEPLMEQHRIPMDKTYSYKTVNGASVINMGPNSMKKNKTSIHEFIYGKYYAP